MNPSRAIGLEGPPSPEVEKKLIYYINLKLRDLGCPAAPLQADDPLSDLMAGLLSLNREKDRLLSSYLCPVDTRIQNFLYDYLQDVMVPPRLPGRTFVLDRYGLAKILSLPPDRNEFKSDIIHSYRVKQGVLHNPKSDRRTTEGIFHIADGGLPVPDDKKAVPKQVYGNLLRMAFAPPEELLRLPFTASQETSAECFVSLLLRPVVCPEVPGYTPEKSLEVRFFAPGSLVSNLDFVESIFGNGGDPYLPENDSGLDVEHWTGHTGCVVLAPHLIKTRKKHLGLPHYDQATDRQRRDGMCWKSEDELYNNGTPFKITARDSSGVMVTVISDNYFGYCKKEVKTQISFAANLYGACEEEHSGGALIFPSYDLAEDFLATDHHSARSHTMDDTLRLLGDAVTPHPEGHATDRLFSDIVYVPENASFDLQRQSVKWKRNGEDHQIKLRLHHTYVLPSGYKIHMEKPPGNRAWRLIGTVAEATLCHKPCTVSGGGKSEISKSISDAIIQGPVFVSDFKADFQAMEGLLDRDYSHRFRDPLKNGVDKRPILSPQRSLGSVIKLLTPSAEEYSDAYNSWLSSIPQHIKELVFVVKRFYKPDWGHAWREHFSVDVINGTPANELRCRTRKLVSNFLRVGFEGDGAWRTFGLRKDFHPAVKIQMEDDITASVVVPARAVQGLEPSCAMPSVKFVRNCEYRLFQRPDEAIHRGYDHQTELDFSRGGNFFSNYEPLSNRQAVDLLEDSIGFFQYTEPMQEVIQKVAESNQDCFFVSSAHPRIVGGKPSKNPRYLQIRPDLLAPRLVHLADVGLRLARAVPRDQVPLTPVNAVLAGRRNNPGDTAAGIRSLAVYNPIHYMELPELFMEFICSMTGKSPSTTGAGSEGALTKGPFNALPPIYDLNAALLSYLVTGYDAFLTSAGCVGPQTRVDHDISLLVPEIWCRMSVEERDPKFLIRNGYLERCVDFEHEGKPVLASRLGYRITSKFVKSFFGRVFNHPHVVLSEAMLKPELQDIVEFVDGMDNILATQRRVAAHYFKDGSVQWACPPLKALLHIMVHDQHEGRGLDHPEIRALFTREYALKSEWYLDRLRVKQRNDIQLWQRHAASLEKFLGKPNYAEEATRLGIRNRLRIARSSLERAKSREYLDELIGTIGSEPSIQMSATW